MVDDKSAVTVGVAGDWHGNIRWAGYALSAFHRLGAREVWHLGDFGLWPGGGSYLDEVESACARLGISILVTPGNHEDYGRLSAASRAITRVRDHIAFLPRGHRFAVNGWNVLSFGGAPSVDFEYRTEGVSWWPAELPADHEIDAAINDGPCDILLLHDSSDAPHITRRVERIVSSTTSGWSDRALAYARVGRERITRLRTGVEPQMALHGHYHVAGSAAHADGSRTIALAGDGDDGNLGILSLPPKQADGHLEFSFLAEALAE